MPFGAEVLEGGKTRFNLWAPAAETADLVLGEVTIPMPREANGTFSLATDARSGARYLFRIDGVEVVPDPASRSQPEDVHGASQVVDPLSFAWRNEHWGRPWEEVVLYVFVDVVYNHFGPEGNIGRLLHTFRVALLSP